MTRVAITQLATGLALAGCATSVPPPDEPTTEPHGKLNGVLAANAAVLFVPVGTDEQGCTQYTKRPLREDILVDTGIWYRTANDRFVLDASRCAPERESP